MNATNINAGTLGEEQEFNWSYKEACVPFLIKPPKRWSHKAHTLCHSLSVWCSGDLWVTFRITLQRPESRRSTELTVHFSPLMLSSDLSLGKQVSEILMQGGWRLASLWSTEERNPYWVKRDLGQLWKKYFWLWMFSKPTHRLQMRTLKYSSEGIKNKITFPIENAVNKILSRSRKWLIQ